MAQNAEVYVVAPIYCKRENTHSRMHLKLLGVETRTVATLSHGEGVKVGARYARAYSGLSMVASDGRLTKLTK